MQRSRGHGYKTAAGVSSNRPEFLIASLPAYANAAADFRRPRALRMRFMQGTKKGPGSIIDPGNHQWFQSAVAPESLMTFVHLIISDLMNAANCALLPAAISTPRSAKRD